MTIIYNSNFSVKEKNKKQNQNLFFIKSVLNNTLLKIDRVLYLNVRPVAKRILALFVISLLVFTIGAYAVYFFSNQKRNSVIDKFFSFAKSVSATLNVDDLKKLEPIPSEKSTENYINFKKLFENLVGFSKNLAVDSIYSMVKKDGKIVFILDSTLAENEPVVPGDPYQQPPQELLQVFNENKTILTKPYTDEWGTYISAFIPISDSVTDQLVTVIGFDIDYSLLQKEVLNESYLIASIVILIWLMIMGIYIYISTLREKSLILKDNEELFRTVFVSSLDPIVIIDLDCNISKWNQSAETLFGYTEVEVRGKALDKVIFIEEKCSLSEMLGKVTEMNVKNKNGEMFFAEISLTPIKLKGKTFVFLIIRNINARKKIEADLAVKASELASSKEAIINVLEDVEKEKAQTESLLSGIGDGVVAIDKNFNVIFINKITEEQLGWTIEEMIGRDFYDLVKAENNKGEILPKEKRPFFLSLNSGDKITTSVTDPSFFIRKDGKKFPVAITVTPVKIKDEIIGAIGVFRDITHEMEVDKMKSEFVSLVSHQLRTPLSAMRWYAEMLLNGDAGKLTEDQIDFIENIYKSNERMINLVNSLLNISRIESGRIIIEPKPTDLKGLIDEVMSEVKVKFDEKKQTVLISVHPDLGSINLDPKLIFQVYKNLLTNANKYTPDHGQIEIFVSKKGEDVISRVTDNGYGISLKDQPKIFEKFHRAENILKLETDGTGLGLYLAKSIVESSGGQIGFESEENKGTTFWFTLPIKGVAPQKGEVSLTD